MVELYNDTILITLLPVTFGMFLFISARLRKKFLPKLHIQGTYLPLLLSRMVH